MSEQRNSVALAIQSDQERFTAAQIAVLKQAGLGDVNQPTLDAFLLQCQRTGLDPFTRQIFLIPRGSGKFSIQTSIDGFRLIATRTGVYVGSEEAWAFDENNYPVSATVTVYRLVGGLRCPFSATAHMCEYDQANQMWKKYPARMIAKCAEALALRKAFPQELSALYSDDEYAPAIDTAPQQVKKVLAPPKHIDPVEVVEEYEEVFDFAKILMGIESAVSKEDAMAIYIENKMKMTHGETVTASKIIREKFKEQKAEAQ